MVIELEIVTIVHCDWLSVNLVIFRHLRYFSVAVSGYTFILYVTESRWKI